MLDYEWASTNPQPIILSGEESEPVFNADPTHSQKFPTFVDQHHNTFFPPPPPPPPSTAAFSSHYGGFYDNPQSYTMGPSSHHYDAVAGGGGEFVVVPKSEDVCGNMAGAAPVEFAARIGLNLGGRTYFSSEEEEYVNRIYRRTRTGGEMGGSGNWTARCQAEGCNADLSQAKHYHRRHKVCEFHSKASTVITAGLTQRFCQQCSRFHVLAEFDNGKRSCRKRLADHNRRRRKTQQSHQGSPKPSQPLETTTSSTDSAASRVGNGVNRTVSVVGDHGSVSGENVNGLP